MGIGPGGACKFLSWVAHMYAESDEELIQT